MLALPIAQSVYRIPVQVSDSLDVILVADEAPSTSALLARLGAAGTLRPLRYVQARWMIAIDRLAELLLREKLWTRSLKLQRSKRTGFILGYLFLRKRRVPHNVSKDVENLIHILD